MFVREMWLAIAYLFFQIWYCFAVDCRHNCSVPARIISLSCSEWQHLINVWLSSHSSRIHQIRPLHPAPFLFPGLFLCVYINTQKQKALRHRTNTPSIRNPYPKNPMQDPEPKAPTAINEENEDKMKRIILEKK